MNDPLYAFTIGDNSSIWTKTQPYGSYNPSLPIVDMLGRIADANAMIALAPQTDTTMAFQQYLIELGGSSDSIKQAVQIFNSENDIETYCTNKGYDDSGNVKIAGTQAQEFKIYSLVVV